ncbi:amidohydrolase [Jiella endophytica]|uniref:Amidohydrolase n=1 Tax=Jiella endophytica TaxID=2558362 RepID=A0A4Y8R8C0_9HYPH|nr:amidohydrolase [Jiella endophytica]TFF17854.1 amidohydrolase [Jiella endophytica]
MSAPIKVYRARKIITMSRNRPTATHVALRDGRVLGVGEPEELARWGELEIDERFADKVLMPGFVEGHAHAMEGAVWRDLYVGYFVRRSPDGEMEGGLKSLDAVVERLRRYAETLPEDKPVVAWGFDPLYFDGRRMDRHDLDKVSTTRPVLVLHASFHILNVNSRVIEMAGMGPSTNVEGVMKDPAGEPNGELQEMAAMFAATRAAKVDFDLRTLDGPSLYRYAGSATIAGVTTATDLHNKLDDEMVDLFAEVTAKEDFPLRLVPALGALSWSPDDGIAQAKAIRERSTDKLRLGLVKVMTDGSIQGFTGRLKWPGYHNGAPNGIWNIAPSELKRTIGLYHDAGLHMHIHTNGDQASEFVIDCLEEALTTRPRRDHRHTLQHCQMADAAQFRRMAALGVCANLFANHVFYWGDQHYALTMGPDRARRMDATATALACGVPLAIHSDAPVTPLAPLFTAWCAVNRRTSSGRLLGPEERLTPEQALFAITLGAAYTLKLDHLVGSIEVGKFADFAVLDDDPLAVAPDMLKDVGVWGTVLGGIPFESPARAAS